MSRYRAIECHTTSLELNLYLSCHCAHPALKIPPSLYHDDDSLIIAFRGSEHFLKHMENWLINFQITPVDTKLTGDGHIHDGYKDAVTLFWPQLRKILPDLLASPTASGDLPNRNVYWTGHSLGGALATIAPQRVFSLALGDVKAKRGCRAAGSAELLFEGVEEEQKSFQPLAAQTAAICTFASPPVGSGDYAKYMMKIWENVLYERVVIDGDIVPTEILAVQAGTEVRLIGLPLPPGETVHSMEFSYLATLKAIEAASRPGSHFVVGPDGTPMNSSMTGAGAMPEAT